MTNFPKLISATCTEKDGKFIYTGTFEDGSSKVLRTSEKACSYVSVAHVIRDWVPFQHIPARTTEDFVFGGKAKPTVHKFQRKWVAAIVQIAAVV